jgi:hypothetical protein
MTTQDLSESPIIDDLTTEELVQQSYKDMIETVISSLEENDTAMVMEQEGGHLWKFEYGTVEVFVQLTGESEDDLLTVWSSVLKLPAKDEPQLMKKLLEMNWSGTFETCFGMFNNEIVVLFQRSVSDLSAEEISRAITLVANIADDNDEPLQAEFGLS